MSFAQLTLVGNVGQMPDFKQVSGKEVCNFTLATNRKVKGEKITTWFSVVCWDERKNAIIRDYVRKGNPLMVVGQLSTRMFKTKDGETRTALDVDISFNGNLVLLASADRGDDEPRSAVKKQVADTHDVDDDIPF